MNRSFVIGIIAIAGNAFACFSQDVAKDFSATYNAYLADNLSMDFRVLLFKDENDKKGTELGKGVIRKVKNNYYSNYGGYEYIINGARKLIVNNARKEIMYFNDSLRAIPPKINPADMDSMLSVSDSVIFEGVKDGKKIYRFLNSNASITSTDIYIDLQSGLISRIEYFYKTNTKDEEFDAHKTVVEYTLFSTINSADKKYFAISKYVNENKSKVTTANQYAQYQLKVISKQ